MTQRLKRDNFQEQDMRMIAEILGCSFRLSIMEQIEMETEKEQIKKGNHNRRSMPPNEILRLAS